MDEGQVKMSQELQLPSFGKSFIPQDKMVEAIKSRSSIGRKPMFMSDVEEFDYDN